MKLKQRVGDFRVRELLEPDYLKERGEFRVYRVTKRKLTTPEAVRALADEAGVEPSAIQVAGLKDRQGVTIQHMSVERGKSVRDCAIMLEAMAGHDPKDSTSAELRVPDFEAMLSKQAIDQLWISHLTDDQLHPVVDDGLLVTENQIIQDYDLVAL